MSLLASSWFYNMETNLGLWWDGKSEQQKVNLELIAAIIAPSLGSVLGMMIVSFI
jgi:hypothetical protein